MPVPDEIQQLRSGRALHKAWLVRAELLVNGLPLTGEQAPVLSKECSFGEWLNDLFNKLRGFPAFKKTKESHDALHSVYSEIYALTSHETKGLGKLFGASKKTKKAKHLQAEMLLVRLHAHYDDLMSLLVTLEKDYLMLKAKPKVKIEMESMQTKSFRDVAKMMEELEKDMDKWVK